jgi:ADP-heptose:LPS heptosyltransferase
LAKPSPTSSRPRLLVLELWGVGDVALAIPFLRAAAAHSEVTLLAKPHASPLLKRFAPEVSHVALSAPWTAFRGKYALQRWPWRALRETIRTLRAQRFDLGVSARVDPRDHVLLRAAGVRRSVGFPRLGSGGFLAMPLRPPAQPHRAEHWRALAAAVGWSLASMPSSAAPARRIAIHTGAGQAVRQWPVARFAELARRLRAQGYDVALYDDTLRDIDRLVDALATADRFIGNDSGPGHLAALLGIPTFTIFGPQLPELFTPQHALAGWIDGAPCPYKPCFDACRFSEAKCLVQLGVDEVWKKVAPWLEATAPAAS